ncbi:UNVERIFIED_CONTAM: hypothetical protein NCL1_36920 [Trichonephila clavipes]
MNSATCASVRLLEQKVDDPLLQERSIKARNAYVICHRYCVYSANFTSRIDTKHIYKLLFFCLKARLKPYLYSIRFVAAGHKLPRVSLTFTDYLKCTAMKFLVVCLIVLVTITACHASSYSMSCSTGPDGRMKCVQQSDLNGNYAGAFSNTNRMGSQMLAQAGVPGYYKYNYANMKYV